MIARLKRAAKRRNKRVGVRWVFFGAGHIDMEVPTTYGWQTVPVAYHRMRVRIERGVGMKMTADLVRGAA
jgi:hypothetical protein